MPPTAWFGTVAGGLLATLGVLGLAVTGLHGSAGTPQRLLVLVVSPGQNLLHVVLGVAMVAGVTRPDAATTHLTAVVGTTVLAALAGVGLLAPAPIAGPLALGGAVTVLHLGLAGWGTAATLRTTHARSRSSGGPTPPRTTATRNP